MEDLAQFRNLVAILDRLRDPDGCPWDREQTYETLRGYLVEECFEVAEALDREDLEGLREELGDLLLQIVFLSRIAKEQGHFTVDDVAHTISDKLVRRHPHVFGSTEATTADDVARNWEAIKRSEKGDREHSRLDGVPAALRVAGEVRVLGDDQETSDWELRQALVRRRVSEPLRRLVRPA